MRRPTLSIVVLLCALCVASDASAHNVSETSAGYLAGLNEAAFPLFMYLGAKHMVTGVDHVLYLFAVVFLLYVPRDVLRLVTLFALGHSLTLISGMLFNWQVNASAVDALIGLSIVYKGFENLNGWRTLFGLTPPVGIAVFAFGLCHGLGLATKLGAVYERGEGFVVNLIGFNVGVEVGQLIALMPLLLLLAWWRQRAGFARYSGAVNTVLMGAGFAFAGYHALGAVLGPAVA
ncbi:MAG: HupE/UreJ family protein [Pseudomonadota bacterium]